MNARTELSELYQTESSTEVKKKILHAMFIGGDSDRLIELAKSERDPELRRAAIQSLGLMKRQGTIDALVSIYNGDQSPEIRKTVVNALFIQNSASTLVALARAEKNPDMTSTCAPVSRPMELGVFRSKYGSTSTSFTFWRFISLMRSSVCCGVGGIPGRGST